MAMNKLIRQNFRNNFRKYEITEKGLAIEVKEANDYISYLMEYEDIGFDEVVRKLVPNRLEYTVFFSAILNAILIGVLIVKLTNLLLWIQIILAASAIGGFFYWGRKLLKLRKIKVLEGHQDIIFYYFNQHRAEVDTFITNLKAYRRNYLRGKYMKYDDLDDEDIQKNTYMWLYREKVISRDELRDLNDEINNGRIIGGF